MKTENRVASYLADAEKAFEPAETKEHVGIKEAPSGAFCSGGGRGEVTEFNSSAWISDLRKISAGQGMLVHLHVGAGPAEEILALRQDCEALRRDYTKVQATLDTLEKTVGLMRDAAERGALERFANLCAIWKRETRLASNITKKSIHPAYQQIIGMGYAAVGPILMDLAENGPEHWFWALTAITGENPITEEMAGKMDAMTEAWLKWGVKKGFLKDLTPRTKQHSQASSASAIG